VIGRLGAQMKDRFELKRFVAAQSGVYETARDELRGGRKQSHWMWFVFPQIQGLGLSQMSRTYAITSLDEAAAYLAHPVLGPRLRECTGLVLAIDGRSIDQIFGSIDAQKFRSSMTLFATAVPEEPLFRAALKKFCEGILDDKTLTLLRR
jgi:uncharacterized protein (DUF1810 family)